MSARLLLALCLLGAVSQSVARADASPYLGRENPLAALLPSAAALEAREAARRERFIERALMSLPHVERAEVLVTRAAVGEPLDQPVAKESASVRLEVSMPAPSDAEIMRVVRATLPALRAEDVHVLRSQPRPSAQASSGSATGTARVGPFVVAAESSGPLRATLALCLTANAVLAALLLARRRAR